MFETHLGTAGFNLQVDRLNALFAQGSVGALLPWLEHKTELARPMPRSKRLQRFKSRREAERTLAEIIADGGRPCEFRIEELPEGGCVIVVLEDDGQVAGMLSV
jgi:hypothetical protein